MSENYASVTLNTTDNICINILTYIANTIDATCLEYHSTEEIDFNEYNEKETIFHIFIPKFGTYFVEDFEISISHLLVNNESVVINEPRRPFQIVKEVIITEKNTKENKNIIKFIDKCLKADMKRIQELANARQNKIHIKTFNGFSWSTMSIIPKRNPNTFFLKEGQLDTLKKIIDSFTNEKTYNDYIANGVPYKCNILLHGSPGVGKTSAIHYIASLYNVDICTFNLNSELKESEFLLALRSINTDSKWSLLVIEDIDCIFEDRKAHDSSRNNITLHCLLNALDGFNSKEGMVIIMTTNHPKKLDEAFLRTRRIDHKIEFTYLNRYQAQNMFNHFFENQTSSFDILWDRIKDRKIPPSTFHHFLFTNRNNVNITIAISELMQLLDANQNINMYN